MFGKLTSVVRSDGLEMLSLVWHEQPPYGLCRRHGLLAMLEFLHDEEVRAAFYHREDGVAVLVDNQVHLPVPEPPAVCLLRTFVYAYPVPDTRRLGYMPARGTAVILHLMAAVGGKCPTRIVADHPVNGLVGDPIPEFAHWQRKRGCVKSEIFGTLFFLYATFFIILEPFARVA